MNRKLTILLLALSLLIPLAGARADSAASCGDLSDADCQIIQANMEIMDDLSAFAFDMSMSLSVDSEADEEDFELWLTGSGAIEMDSAAVEELAALESAMTMQDIAPLVDAVLGAVAGDITFSLSQTAADGESSFDLALRMKDGVLLLNAGVLEEMTGESMSGMEWFGLDMTGAGDILLESADMSEMPEMPADHGQDMEAVEAAATTITRLPDSVIDGVDVAVFESRVDLEAIFSLLALDDLADMTETEGDAQSPLGLLEWMAASDMSSREYIGLDDLYTHRVEMSADLTMTADESGQTRTANLVMRIEMDLSDFGQPVVVDIPEDAVVLPLLMMMQMAEA